MITKIPTKYSWLDVSRVGVLPILVHNTGVEGSAIALLPVDMASELSSTSAMYASHPGVVSSLVPRKVFGRYFDNICKRTQSQRTTALSPNRRLGNDVL